MASQVRSLTAIGLHCTCKTGGAAMPMECRMGLFLIQAGRKKIPLWAAAVTHLRTTLAMTLGPMSSILQSHTTRRIMEPIHRMATRHSQCRVTFQRILETWIIVLELI